jgi:hypothetical protein
MQQHVLSGKELEQDLLAQSLKSRSVSVFEPFSLPQGVTLQMMIKIPKPTDRFSITDELILYSIVLFPNLNDKLQLKGIQLSVNDIDDIYHCIVSTVLSSHNLSASCSEIGFTSVASLYSGCLGENK